MFQFKRDFNESFCGARNVDRTRELNPFQVPDPFATQSSEYRWRSTAWKPFCSDACGWIRYVSVFCGKSDLQRTTDENDSVF